MALFVNVCRVLVYVIIWSLYGCALQREQRDQSAVQQQSAASQQRQAVVSSQEHEQLHAVTTGFYDEAAADGRIVRLYYGEERQTIGDRQRHARSDATASAVRRLQQWSEATQRSDYTMQPTSFGGALDGLLAAIFGGGGVVAAAVAWFRKRQLAATLSQVVSGVEAVKSKLPQQELEKLLYELDVRMDVNAKQEVRNARARQKR